MSECNIYVHVGLPKAASTTLQKHLFSKHEMLLSLGVYPVDNVGSNTDDISLNAAYLNDSRVKDFYSHLIHDDVMEFDYETVSNELSILFKDYATDKNEKIVFSDEKLTSTFYSHKDIGLKAKRLKKVLPDAKIIIVLRDQVSWITSQYRDHPFDPRHLDIGRPVSVEKWIEIAQWSAEVKLLSMLKYNELVTLYEDIFGVENVCVLLFEEFVNDLPQFANKLSEFMGIDCKQTFQCLQDKHENTGVSTSFNVYRGFKRKYLSYGAIGRIYNDKFKESVESLVRHGNKQDVKISVRCVNRLSAIFSRGNTLLNTRRSLGMERYSYQLKDELDI